MVDAVILDVDGTLIDNNLLHALAWRRAFERVGRTVDSNTLVHLIAMGSDKLPLAVLGEGEAAAAAKVAEYQGEEYSGKGLIDASRPLPCARELIDALHERGLKVALATSGKRAEVDRYLEMLGDPDGIDEIVTMQEVEGSKPEPDIFAVALAKLGDPEGAVVIGDTVYDVEAAAKLGLPCVCVLSGGIEREVLVAAGAAALYDDAADVLAHLDEVLNPSDVEELVIGE